jgi:CheY-like chemotaxis protein
MSLFLIVEDEPDSANMLEMILAPAGVPTQLADTAEDALVALRQNPSGYALVIIDLALPGKDGFALLDAIKSDASLSHLPTVAITAYHTPELRSRATKAGFSAYVPKPLDTSVFLGTLERLLGA